MKLAAQCGLALLVAVVVPGCGDDQTTGGAGTSGSGSTGGATGSGATPSAPEATDTGAETTTTTGAGTSSASSGTDTGGTDTATTATTSASTGDTGGTSGSVTGSTTTAGTGTGSSGSTTSSTGPLYDDYGAAGLPVAIPDDDPQGVCVTIDVPPAPAETVVDVRVTLGVDHGWLGDLAVTLEEPGGTVLVHLFDQPGVEGGVGARDSSDLASDYPIVFRDDSFNDAEQMGNILQNYQVACRDDGWCDYAPRDPLAGFAGIVATGAWTLCAFDGEELVQGTLVDAVLSIATM